MVRLKGLGAVGEKKKNDPIWSRTRDLAASSIAPNEYYSNYYSSTNYYSTTTTTTTTNYYYNEIYVNYMTSET
jgi:hypothetical protein